MDKSTYDGPEEKKDVIGRGLVLLIGAGAVAILLLGFATGMFR